MFTKFTTVRCTVDSGDLEGADSKTVGRGRRTRPPTFSAGALTRANEQPATLCHPATVAECQVPPPIRMPRWPAIRAGTLVAVKEFSAAHNGDWLTRR